MNRPVTAVFAALESLLVVGIGVGIPVVSLTFLWAFQYGLQVDWLVFWRAGVDVWLVGHGVDLTLTLSKSAAAATGITGAGAPIVISIAALGFALATVLLGARAGRRLAETSHRATGSAAAIAAFAVLSWFVTLTARQPSAEPSLAQGIVLPTLVFAVPLLVAAEVNRRRRAAVPDAATATVLRAVESIPASYRRIAGVAVRSGLAIAAVVLAVAGLVVGLLLATHYAQVITLFEGAHGGVLGGLALTIGQIALLPNAVVWAASWFVGPGFALGTGSSVSPIGTSIGPMPAVPFLGALPTGAPSFGFVGILVPVVAAFVIVTLLRPALERRLGDDDTLPVRVIAGVASGLVAGIVLGVASAMSAGSAGPGRLADVGPNALTVGLFAALEVAVPAVLALVVRRPDIDSGRLGNLAAAVTERVTDRLPERVTDRLPERVTDRLPERVTSRSGTPESKPAAPDPERDSAVSTPRDGSPQDAIPTERLDGFTR